MAAPACGCYVVVMTALNSSTRMLELSAFARCQEARRPLLQLAHARRVSESACAKPMVYSAPHQASLYPRGYVAAPRSSKTVVCGAASCGQCVSSSFTSKLCALCHDSNATSAERPGTVPNDRQCFRVALALVLAPAAAAAAIAAAVAAVAAEAAAAASAALVDAGAASAATCSAVCAVLALLRYVCRPPACCGARIATMRLPALTQLVPPLSLCRRAAVCQAVACMRLRARAPCQRSRLRACALCPRLRLQIALQPNPSGALKQQCPGAMC
jgi:hypothetical protein